MKVIMNKLEKVDLEEFANKNNLTMCVSERDIIRNKYTAKFAGAEVKKGMTLESAYGVGSTPEEAIADYCKQISGQWIVIDAYGGGRQVIWTPHLVPVFTMEVQA